MSNISESDVKRALEIIKRSGKSVNGVGAGFLSKKLGVSKEKAAEILAEISNPKAEAPKVAVSLDPKPTESEETTVISGPSQNLPMSASRLSKTSSVSAK
jgi:hypothetical protein